MSSGELQWSGRAVRWLLWRAPRNAVLYTYRSNLALASDIGRRWIVLAMFGLWLWGFRWVTVHVVPPLRWLSAVLLLVWFLHGLNLVRWTLHARAGAARARALAREQHEILGELRSDMREAVSAAARSIPTPGGTFTMLRMKGHDDPVAAEHRRRGREQADQVREWLGDDQDVPLGDEFEPILFRFPRRRARKPKGGEGE